MPDAATVSVSRAAHFFGWNSFISAWNSKPSRCLLLCYSLDNKGHCELDQCLITISFKHIVIHVRYLALRTPVLTLIFVAQRLGV